MENPLSSEQTAPTNTPNEPSANNEQPARPAIRTLHSDIASSVRDNNISITKIALAQQAKNADLPFVTQETKRFWSAWSIGTILLIVGGVVIIAGAIFIAVSKTVSLPFTEQTPLAPTLVPVESQRSIDTTRMPLADVLKNISDFTQSSYASPVALEALIINETVTATSSNGEPTTTLAPLSLERFLERVRSRAPGRFMRSAGPDMTLGRAGETPFIVTTVASYESAFAGMLEWEPLLAEDLPFITKKQTTSNEQQTPDTASSSENQTASTTVATSTSSTTPVIAVPVVTPPPAWKDIIVRNKDVRALVADNGDILVLYAFPKDGFLVITRTKEAFSLIVDALTAPVFGM